MNNNNIAALLILALVVVSIGTWMVLEKINTLNDNNIPLQVTNTDKVSAKAIINIVPVKQDIESAKIMLNIDNA